MPSDVKPPAASQPEQLLRQRWEGPVVVSYAQNAEDVRLWRVFASEPGGFYVDVGASDPVTDSVTKLFYDAGWSGINVEPGPKYELLEAARPLDVNVEAAISATSGQRTLWISSPEPGLSSLERVPDALLPDGFIQIPKPIAARRLDEVLAQYAACRTIDFLKIDVEGAEAEVLESFELEAVRPTVLVVEVVAPSARSLADPRWESVVLGAGYLEAAFDGVNKFYVPEERADLVPVLGYPISILDRYVPHEWRPSAESEFDLAPWSRGDLLRDQRDARLAREALETLDEMKRTISWRITRPLRSLRRAQIARTSTDKDVRAGESSAWADERDIVMRLAQIEPLIDVEPRIQPNRAETVEQAAERIASSIDRSPVAPESRAWLVMAAVLGEYPDDREVTNASRVLRVEGAAALLRLLLERRKHAPRHPDVSAELEIVSGQVVVDVGQVVTSDFHTGIQRVAREVVSHWTLLEPRTLLAHFDGRAMGLKLLSASEAERLRRWRDDLHEPSRSPSSRKATESSGKLLVPWQCDVIVPELPDREHGERVRALATSGTCKSLSIIGFDLVPIVAPETASPELPDLFCHYLSLVKCADRLSAISKQTARDFEAFTTMLEGEGLRGPEVRAHPLPTSVPVVTDSELDSARSALGLRDLPLILVVGVHDPRKNHLVVLEAAERLWEEGHVFELLFIGGGGWCAHEFDWHVQKLAASGRPVSVRRRASETELWAAYALARFSVYPSLLEGYGLPIAESLALGTPVVTSGHGSMAELAEGGGALLVNPRDIAALTDQMRSLLSDDALLESLRTEARARDFGSWESYALDVWRFFVGASA